MPLDRAAASPRKKSARLPSVEAVEIRRPGRPSRLTDAIADALVEQIAAGAGLAGAARAVGVPALAAPMEAAGLVTPAAGCGLRRPGAEDHQRPRARPVEPSAMDWQAAAAFLEGEYGERWGPIEPEVAMDDLLGELD
jgi:hypothetical protein